MVPALTVSWSGNVTAKRRSETEIGREENGEIETDGGHAAQTGTKTAVNAEEAVAAAGTGEMSEETKRGTEVMTEAKGKTETTTKTGAPRESGHGIERAGKRRRTEDIKMIGSDTERRGRPKGRAGVEAGRKGTKLEKKKVGNVSEATAKRGNETGTGKENHGLTNVVVAKKGAIISGSLVMTIVNIVNAEGVRALIKQCF